MRRLGLALVLAAVLPAGCQFGRPKPYANDPLLRCRNAVRGTPVAAELRVPPPPDEPAPPPVPATRRERGI